MTLVAQQGSKGHSISRTEVAKLALLLALSVGTPSFAQAAPVSDMFAGETWHAIKTSWPGTMKFNGVTKKVVLQPLGAPPITADYRYTVEMPAGSPAGQEGTLTMTGSTGGTSVAAYRVNGRLMELTFPGTGKNLETYLRMTPEEEKDEIARIEKLLSKSKK